MKNNNKKYGMGGAVQSFSSPMLAQGMQGSLSGFGTSGLGTFEDGGILDNKHLDFLNSIINKKQMADGGQMSEIERILAKYKSMDSNKPKEDETSEFIRKSWEGKNLDDYIMYSDRFKQGGEIAEGACANLYDNLSEEDREELMREKIGVGRTPSSEYKTFSQLTEHHKNAVINHFKKKMAQGGIFEHGLQEGDKIVKQVDEKYLIVESKAGVYSVVDIEKGSRFIVGLDDSKTSGKRKSAKAGVKEAMEYIAYLKTSKMANGGTFENGGLLEDAKIYVADLADYNSGKLVGKWLDLSDYSSGAEVMEAIQEMLDEQTKNDRHGEIHEEYAIHDFEGFPRSFYSESMGESDFDRLYEIAKIADDSNLPLEVLMEAMSDLGYEDNPERVAEEFSQSVIPKSFGNEWSDFAYEYIDSIGSITDAVSNPDFYFDYESFGSDARMDYTDEELEEYGYDELDDTELGERLVDEMGGIEQLDNKTIEMYFDYDKFGQDLEYDYIAVESEDGNFYFFNRNFAKGGEISDELIEYTIPTWAVSSLINGDDSGLEDEDIEKLDKFVSAVVNQYGNAIFMLGEKSEESEFSPYNDIDSLGSNVTTLYIRPSAKFAKGGKTKSKKTKGGEGDKSYTFDGENYSYSNTFGVDQNDFIKLVDVFHTTNKSNATDRIVERLTYKEFESKYGADVLQKVVGYIKQTHENQEKGGESKGDGYTIYVYANTKVGEDPTFPNVESITLPNLQEVTIFVRSLIDENITEIDKIEVFSKSGQRVQTWHNSESDKNLKEKYLHKQKIPNNYQGKTAEQVWSLLTPAQRSHYLEDHENGEYKNFIYSDWNELNDRVRNGFEMHTQQGQYAKGGEVGQKFNLSFHYNPSNLSNKDAEKIVEKHTKEWRRNNDLDEVSFYVMGLTKSKADNLKRELEMEDVYEIEIQSSRYEKGGDVAEDLFEKIKKEGRLKRYLDVRGNGKKVFETIVPNKNEKGMYKRYESLSKDDLGVLQNEYLDESDVKHHIRKTSSNHYAKGGGVEGTKYYTIFTDEEGDEKTEFNNYDDALADFNYFVKEDANIKLYEISESHNLLKEHQSSADIQHLELSNGNYTLTLEKEDGKWVEKDALDGEQPYGWGGKTYMGYLKPKDIVSYLNRDYGGDFKIIEQYAKGGKVSKKYDLKDAKKISENERFELKVLQGLLGFNSGLNINGLYESIGFSNYRFNKYATESQAEKVEKALNSLIKKGYVDESGLGYKITQKGADYKREFAYGSYAKGGEISKSEKLDLLKKELEDNGIYFDLDTDIQKKKYLIVYPIGDNDAFIEHYSFFIDRKGKYEMGFYYIDGEGEKVQTFNDVNEVMNYLKNEKLKTTANKKEESQRIEARKKNYEVVSEIKKKYSIAGNDDEGVWTFSKMIADEIAKKYNGDVQQDGSKWYVSLRKYAKGGKIDGEIYIVHFEINGKKHTSEYLLYQGDRIEKMLPPIANIISIKKKNDENGKTKYANGGVTFIEYKDNEIMYEPTFNKYYANDVEFDSLEDAKKFLDSGEISSHIKGAYSRGLFEKGGDIAQGNYEMMLSQAKEIKHHNTELQNILKSEKDIDAWVVAKMENASSSLSDITHYLDGKTEYAQGGEIDEIKVGDYYKTSEGEIFYIEKINKQDKNYPYFVTKSKPTDLGEVISAIEFHRYLKNGFFQKVEGKFAEGGRLKEAVNYARQRRYFAEKEEEHWEKRNKWFDKLPTSEKQKLYNELVGRKKSLDFVTQSDILAIWNKVHNGSYDKYAEGGEVEDKNQYDFSIRIYKDNLDILNDNPDYEDFRGTKKEILKKVNDSLKKGEILYAYVWIENIVTDWYHESGDLERMRMEVNRYGEYARGGKTNDFKVGDIVLLKYDIRYNRGDTMPLKIVDIDGKMLALEDASKYRSKKVVVRGWVDASFVIPFENYEKEKLNIIKTFAKGGVVRNNKFQNNLEELLKQEGFTISFYDNNVNEVPKEKAEVISLTKWDDYYENFTLKLPSKMEVTFEWIMNKLSNDKIYKSFAENFNKILKAKGYSNLNAYPTTYGIGVFLYGRVIEETKTQIEELLNSLGIDYKTEYSEGNWVFRYRISKSKENIAKINEIEMTYAKGGKIGFEGLANKVAKRYVGKKVSKEYQTEYGKTYDAKEAKEVGNKVAGKVYQQQVAKKKIVRKLQTKTN